MKAKTGGRERSWREAERRRRRRILFVCLAASLAVHLAFLFSFGPRWFGKPPRVRPAGGRRVSLTLRPRARDAAPVKAPAPLKAPEAKPAEKPPVRRPVYGAEEIRRKLSRVLSPEIAEKSVKAKETRLREMLQDRETMARTWVSKTSEALRVEEALAEEGTVGYRRVIDLRKCSDFEIGRIMDVFKMEVGYGSRPVTDFNLRFTSEWLLTQGQMRNLASRVGVKRRGKRPPMPPAGPGAVSLEEPTDGPPRSYLSPSAAAVAAIIAAEERYFAQSETEPEELDRVVFVPAWSFRGPGFTVASAEKKAQSAG
ncbi:MAG TPA: hypothetical protein PK696_11690, partial [bacterium]|nr:hypothetical protein [bacterium]